MYAVPRHCSHDNITVGEAFCKRNRVWQNNFSKKVCIWNLHKFSLEDVFLQEAHLININHPSIIDTFWWNGGDLTWFKAFLRRRQHLFCQWQRFVLSLKGLASERSIAVCLMVCVCVRLGHWLNWTVLSNPHPVGQKSQHLWSRIYHYNYKQKKSLLSPTPFLWQGVEKYPLFASVLILNALLVFNGFASRERLKLLFYWKQYWV